MQFKRKTAPLNNASQKRDPFQRPLSKQGQAAGGKYQTRADSSTAQNKGRTMKSARNSRSKSRKATNKMLLEQISKGHTMGRNHMVQHNTCSDRQYRIHYGPDFHESFCENLGSEDDEKNGVDRTMNDEISLGFEVLQDIPSFECNLNKRKDKQMYSFTKNIDYTQLTQTQISNFLKEKKTSAASSPTRPSSLRRNGLRLKEKENHMAMQQQGYQTESDPNGVQVLQVSKVYKANQLNAGKPNQKMQLIKQPGQHREPLSRKYGGTSTMTMKRVPKTSKTPRGESSKRNGSRLTHRGTIKANQRVQVQKSARGNETDSEPANVTMKKLTYQYSMTTARIENFKLVGLNSNKPNQSRNINNLPQAATSARSLPYSTTTNGQDGVSRQSNMSNGKSQSNRRSENAIANTTKKCPPHLTTASKQGTPQSQISKTRNNQTVEAKSWEKLNTVQINLVPDEEDEKVELNVLPSETKGKGFYGLSSTNSIRSNRSSCNEEKMTQRGSLPEKPSLGSNKQENGGSPDDGLKSDIKDDQQYEKHKIWRQSQIEREERVEGQRMGQQHDSVFEQSGLNLMTFIETNQDMQLNQFDPVKSQQRLMDGQDFPNGNYESLRKPKTIAQNCQLGPARPSKIKRNSDQYDVSGLEESRATAKFTNQSITYMDEMDMDSEGNKKLEDVVGRNQVISGENNKNVDTKQYGGEQVFSPVFGKDFESQSLRQNDRNSEVNQDDLNTSWEKAVSDIEARKRQLQQQEKDLKSRIEAEDLPFDRQINCRNIDLDQFATPINIQYIGDGEITRPPILNQISKIKINFGALSEQIEIMKQIRDLLEIRPSQYQNRRLNNSSTDSITSRQAIEGLSPEERQKIKSLCQEWWDSSNEDHSFYRMALQYQQQLDQEELQFGKKKRFTVHRHEEFDSFTEQTQDRPVCMKKCVVLQSVVIGITAFYSMLTRAVQPDESYDLDLDMRQMLHSLLKIIFDQSMLCLSFALGKLSTFEQVTHNRASYENKLYQIYNEYIHLLFINKKIQSEDDYQIYNNKGLVPGLGAQECVTNQENRDCQINKLSMRLIEKINKMIDFEIGIQEQKNKAGNVSLLKVLKHVAMHSKEFEFQDSKNQIYEGISKSDVMPKVDQGVPDGGAYEAQEMDKSSEYMQTGGGPRNGVNQENYQNSESGLSGGQQSKSQLSLNYGVNLIKTFKDDSNLIIHEESREESMSVSMMNSSKKRDDYNSNSIDDKSKYNSQSRRGTALTYKSNKHTPDKTEQFEEKIFEIQDNDSFKVCGKKFEDSIESSMQDMSWSRDIGSKSEVVQQDLLANPQIVRISCMSQSSMNFDQRPQQPFLPPIKDGFKYTLVLDLDETLVHCTPFGKLEGQSRESNPDEDMIVYSRPGLHDFLQEMSKYYEIVIFTAGGKAYAQKIVSQCLEQQRGPKVIDHLLYWDHVTVISEHQAYNMQQRLSKFYSGLDQSVESMMSAENKQRLQSLVNQTSFTMDDYNLTEGGPTMDLHSKKSEFDLVEDLCNSEQDQCYLKDLSKLGRDLRKVLIVDNLPVNFAWQLKNGICIREYRANNLTEQQRTDQALPQLGKMLKDIYNLAAKEKCPDLRSILQDQLTQYRMQKDGIYFV